MSSKASQAASRLLCWPAIRFADFLYSKRLRYLAEALVPILYFALIIYRGPAMMTIAGWAFVYLIKNGLGPKRLAVLSMITFAVIFGFGVLGNLRQGGSENIEKLGKPSHAFEQSGVPGPFLWVYIYFTAPLANLQLAAMNPIANDRVPADLLVGEMLPDFVSKRVLPLVAPSSELTPRTRIDTPEVSKGLNVASIFGRAMVIAGWRGAALMFAEICGLVLLYLRLIRHSPYSMPALALLNVLIVFSTFENMIAHTPVSFQLIWPLVLSVLPNFKTRFQKTPGTLSPD